jgi:hypothetical protein
MDNEYNIFGNRSIAFLKKNSIKKCLCEHFQVSRLFLCTNIGSIPVIAYAMEDGFGAMVENSNYFT